MLYDVHAHIDLYRNRDLVIDYIENNEIYTISMTNVPDLYIKYQKQYSSLRYIKFALGLHPELVFQHHNQISKFIEMLPDAKYIGEIGLDYSSGKSHDDKHLQLNIFEKIIQCCYQCIGPKILSLHSRNAANEVMSVAGNYHGHIILHWFSDANADIRRAANSGYFFSINSQMVDSINGKKIILQIPLDRLLIETDAPFTKRSNPCYTSDQIYYTIRKLSSLFSVDLEEMQSILDTNFRSLLTFLPL